MLRDLDKQQGKISPAVVPQKPSLPRPPVARLKGGWMLLAVVALASVVLWANDSFRFLSGATDTVATTGANNNVATSDVANKASLNDGAGKAAVAAEAVATDTQAKDAVVLEAVVDEQQSSNANQQPSTVAEGLQPAVAAPEDVQSASALLPSSAPSSPPSAVTQSVATETEVTPTTALQPAGFADTAAPSVTTEATALVTNNSVDNSSTDNSTNNSNSFPAQKPAEFIAENAEAAEKAPSSMQVESVVFDAKLQLQRLAEQAGEALHQGQWQRLQQQAQQYIQLAPADVQGYEWLAESYRQLQQWPALQQLLQLCQQLNLQSDMLWLQQGRVASQLKNWPEAEQALQRISPSFAAVEVLQLKANALQQQQKLAEALVAWQQLTTLQPRVGRGWLGQALVLDQQGQKQQAKDAYQQALTTGGLSAATVQFIQQRLAIAE
jgi:tetratricopeptide (TPR) repeat protein